MNLISLTFVLAPIGLSIVGFSLAMLFSNAFESVSRNLESAKTINGMLIIGAGFVELTAILILGVLGMIYKSI